MKRILITGADSYIGISLETLLKQKIDEYMVETLDMRSSTWGEKDFSVYHTVFHVAGIVHRKEKPGMEGLYQKVNQELPVRVAKKAKAEGVAQFIFMSSMSIYGKNTGRINKDTMPKPNSYYGKSKWQAEVALEQLVSETFQVAILRPPMVYGDGCRGNYSLLKKFALKSPLFPNFQNERSMLHIDRLTEYIRRLIDNGIGGTFFPQDEQYICTSDMVRRIAEENGKHIWFTRIFNPIICLGMTFHIEILEKMFGNLVYEWEWDAVWEKK